MITHNKSKNEVYFKFKNSDGAFDRGLKSPIMSNTKNVYIVCVSIDYKPMSDWCW